MDNMQNMFRILAYIHDNPNTTMNQAARTLNLSISTIKRRVVDLKKYGVDVEQIHSRPSAYRINSWGIINKDYFIKHKLKS